jgi:hypothetical protein
MLILLGTTSCSVMCKLTESCNSAAYIPTGATPNPAAGALVHIKVWPQSCATRSCLG